MEPRDNEPRYNEHGSTRDNEQNIVQADDPSTSTTGTNRPLPETGIVQVPKIEQLNMLLVEVVLESTARIDLIKELKGRYQEDALFKTILDKPKEFRNFEVKDDLVYLKEASKRLLCIPKILVQQ